MTKGDKTHGGFRGESKLKYWSRGLKKKSAEEKLASPFNVFMRTELERLKKTDPELDDKALKKKATHAWTAHKKAQQR